MILFSIILHTLYRTERKSLITESTEKEELDHQIERSEASTTICFGSWTFFIISVYNCVGKLAKLAIITLNYLVGKIEK